MWFLIFVFHITSPRVELHRQSTLEVSARDIVRILKNRDSQDFFGQRTEKPQSFDSRKPISLDGKPLHLKQKLHFI